MEFTISPIVPVVPQPFAKSDGLAGVRGHALASRIDASVLPTPTVGLNGVDTEYDEFGRFGAPASGAAEDSAATTLPPRERPAINATGDFRSAELTVDQFDHARSAAEDRGPDAPKAARRSIPAGTTEFPVHRLHDFQYRWAIEVERRALVALEPERPNASTEAVTPADETFATSFDKR